MFCMEHINMIINYKIKACIKLLSNKHWKLMYSWSNVLVLKYLSLELYLASLFQNTFIWPNLLILDKFMFQGTCNWKYTWSQPLFIVACPNTSKPVNLLALRSVVQSYILSGCQGLISIPVQSCGETGRQVQHWRSSLWPPPLCR